MRWLALITLTLGCAHTPTRPCTVVTPELTLTESAVGVASDDFFTLHRDGCWGRCPVYSVTVHADGRVIANGRKFVAHLGALSWRIDPGSARRLLAELVRINVWSLEQKKLVDDVPTARIEGKLGGRVVSVTPYEGEGAMRFETLIDLISEAETRVVGCAAEM